MSPKPYVALSAMIYEKVKHGRIQVLKAGKRTLISEAELEHYVAALRRIGRISEEASRADGA